MSTEPENTDEKSSEIGDTGSPEEKPPFQGRSALSPGCGVMVVILFVSFVFLVGTCLV